VRPQRRAAKTPTCARCFSSRTIGNAEDCSEFPPRSSCWILRGGHRGARQKLRHVPAVSPRGTLKNEEDSSATKIKKCWSPGLYILLYASLRFLASKGASRTTPHKCSLNHKLGVSSPPHKLKPQNFRRAAHIGSLGAATEARGKNSDMCPLCLPEENRKTPRIAHNFRRAAHVGSLGAATEARGKNSDTCPLYLPRGTLKNAEDCSATKSKNVGRRVCIFYFMFLSEFWRPRELLGLPLTNVL